MPDNKPKTLEQQLDEYALRLQNAEIMIMGMASLLSDTLPVAYADDLAALTTAYYASSADLGAFAEAEFHTRES